MRPLEHLTALSKIAAMLASSPPNDIEVELARLESMRASLSAPMIGALHAARGMFALRRGDNDSARRELRSAVSELRAGGDEQAAILAECEALVAEQRLSRSNVKTVIDAARAIEGAATSDTLVGATAATVRGSAHLAAGEPEAAIAALAEAVRRAESHLPERVRALNTLGTLYTALGEIGAATTVLEHACELARRLKLDTSEAIARGQLGALALARGELGAARAQFGAQELLASRLGDRHGQARALTYLAEIALEASQAEAALDLATRAREVAQSSTPPLTIFDAFAERIELLAHDALGERADQAKLDSLKQRFVSLGVSLGAALVDTDGARGLAPSASPALQSALSTLAALGLTQRMAVALRAARGATSGAERDDLDATIAALAQLHPHLADEHASDLVFASPATLAKTGASRLAAQRNLAKLGALHVRGPGLTLALALTDSRTLPSPGVTAAFAGAVGDLQTWAWPLEAKLDDVRRELRSLIGAQGRAVITRCASAAIMRVPFAGDASAHLEGVALRALLLAVDRLAPGAIAEIDPKDETT